MENLTKENLYKKLYLTVGRIFFVFIIMFGFFMIIEKHEKLFFTFLFSGYQFILDVIWYFLSFIYKNINIFIPFLLIYLVLKMIILKREVSKLKTIVDEIVKNSKT